MNSIYSSVWSKNRLNSKKQDTSEELVDFADIVEHDLGPVARFICNLLLCFSQFGFCVVYMVFVSVNLVTYLPGPNDELHRLYVLAVLFPAFVAMSWIRELRWIGMVSLFANITISIS